MPNWCENKLDVRGPCEDVKRFTEQAVGYDPETTPEERCNKPSNSLNFHSLVPIPEEVLKAEDGITQENWVEENWGATRDDGEGGIVLEYDGRVIYQFVTAWEPPIAFLKNVSEKWPTLLFVLDYFEPSMGFTGNATAKSGQIEEHRIGYGGEEE
jgi:hypothetical protein